MNLKRNELRHSVASSSGAPSFFLILLFSILGIGLLLSLSDRGEIGIWLRTIRDFLLVGLLLEVTLFVVSAIYFVWRLGHFIEETSLELKTLSGDARETAHIAQESLQVLHHHLVQPILYLHALWKELQGLFGAWAGLKQAANEEEKIQLFKGMQILTEQMQHLRT